MINNDDKKSFGKLLKSKALYLVLGICFLLVGGIGINVAGNKTPTGTGKTQTEVENTQVQIEKTTQAKEEKQPVEIDIEEFKTQSEPELSTAAVFDSDVSSLKEDEKEKEIVFSSPLTLAMGKDYSRGVPVFSETMKDYRTHNGVDFKGVKGENVSTIAEGTVISVKSDSVWGNSVSIDHGNGIVSCISGLADEALIENGAKVYSDTVIGVVGNIPVENSDEAHIHLEIRVNGELCDPLEILGFSETQSE